MQDDGKLFIHHFSENKSMGRRGAVKYLESCPAGEKPFILSGVNGYCRAEMVCARCQKFGVPCRYFSTCKLGRFNLQALQTREGSRILVSQFSGGPSGGGARGVHPTLVWRRKMKEES